jgi:hypothetical protein
MRLDQPGVIGRLAFPDQDFVNASTPVRGLATSCEKRATRSVISCFDNSGTGMATPRPAAGPPAGIDAVQYRIPAGAAYGNDSSR